MKDSSKGLQSVTMTICNILSNIVWGRMISKKIAADKEELQWTLAYDQLTEKKPDHLVTEEQPEEIISYKDYLDRYFPLKSKTEIPDPLERDRANQENELVRNNKLINFTKPGNPGVKFKNHFEKMVKSLSLPKAAREELGIPEDAGNQVFSKGGSQGDLGQIVPTEPDKTQPDERRETTQFSQQNLQDDDDEDSKQKKGKEEEKGNEEVKTLMNLFGEGKYHLIPSFFRTLIYLKKAKKEFSIVFRTFGQDLNNVIFEFNKFCNGDHPCYSGRGGTPQVKFEGSKNTKDLRIKERSQKGLYYRDGTEINQSALVTGTLKRTNKDDNINDFYSGDIEEGSVNVYRDPIDQYVSILETLKKRSTMAIQDDFEQWQKTSFGNTGGKLLLIDQADYGTQHIFFDDNAGEDIDCCIDVRDVINGEFIPYRKFINKYVMKVEPHRAILEPDYFIKLIEQAEQKRDEEIEKIEQGLDSEDEGNRNQSNENEWEKLQNLPNEEYLMRTILPVLYQGMRVVDLERPVCPLEYLAIYLLKHQDQVKLPPKPQVQNTTI
eukprot:403345711